MLVTDIKKIDDKRSCLYLDYEAFGPLYASDIRRLKLTVGSETDAEKMQQFRSEYFFKRAMNKAVTAIKYSEKCEYDIRQKLKELCYDEEVIDTTLDKLKKYKYIDDARYASVYVRSHIQRKSRREITYALSSKKILDEWIEQAFEENQLPDEREIVEKLIRKKCPVSELSESNSISCPKGISVSSGCFLYLGNIRNGVVSNIRKVAQKTGRKIVVFVCFHLT